MNPQILNFLVTLITVYIGVIIAWVIMSWLTNYNIVNRRNDFVALIDRVLHNLVQPVIAPIQRIIPPMGGLDISPIFLLLGLNFLSAYLRGLY